MDKVTITSRLKLITCFTVIIPVYVLLGAIGFYFIEFSRISDGDTKLQTFRNQLEAFVKCINHGM